jgi:hypothetical protein
LASFRATLAYRLYFAQLGTDPSLNASVSSGGTRWIVIRIAEDGGTPCQINLDSFFSSFLCLQRQLAST